LADTLSPKRPDQLLVYDRLDRAQGQGLDLRRGAQQPNANMEVHQTNAQVADDLPQPRVDLPVDA
jgi:hypothetical protein